MPEVTLLVESLRTKDASDAWIQFQGLYSEELGVLRELSRHQWSQLFFLVSGATHSAQENWTRTELIFTSIMRAGHELTAQEFSKVIKIASRAGLGNVVQEVWNGISKANIPRNLELWNSYLRATCNADETLWHRKFNGSKPKKLEPVSTNDPLKIVSDIFADGLSPDTTTYELVVLSIGNRGDVDYAAAVVSAVWGIKLENAPLDDDRASPVSLGSTVSPGISTLVAIINAYGASNRLVDGLKLMEKMQSLYKISISGDYSMLLWETILKWAYYSTEPWGNTPGIALDAIWTSVVDRHRLQPNGKMFYYKSRRELALRNYSAMLNLIPLILESSNVKNRITYASGILHQAARGLANTGRLDACYEALDNWAPVAPQFAQVKEKLVHYLETSPRVGRQEPIVLSVNQLGLSPGALQPRYQFVEADESWQSEKTDEASSIGLSLA